MNVVDSSAWLEYFADGPNARAFAKAIADATELLVPSITITEVYKRVLQQRGEHDALRAVAHMLRGEVIDLDEMQAIAAARIGHELKLPLADSIILAAARSRNATLWTQDADFQSFDRVKYFPTRGARAE